ncbi:MAG TPA: DMT family transporter [Candidatus Saccharimonadales bacterium]
MNKGKQLLPIIVAIFMALSFVLMGVWARMMNESFTIAQQVFWRFLLAAILCWIIFGHMFSKKVFQTLSKKDWTIYGIRAILNYGVGVLFFTVAVTHTKLSIVSFISSLPIIGLLAWIMFREKFDKKAIPFVALSVIGLALVAGLTLSGLSLGVGAVAAILSMLGFDISYLMVRYHNKKLTNFHNTTLMLSFAWIIPLMLLLIQHQPIVPKHINHIALIGLAVSVVLNIVGLYLLNYIFTHLKAYVAGNILLLEGVFAIIIGYLIYGETISIEELIGAGIIILCAVIISRISMKSRPIETEKLPVS